MNLVGKILTGLIAFFSVLFMALAMAVYAMHVNWKEKVDHPQTGLKVQLQKETQAKNDFKNQLDKIQQDFDNEKKRLGGQLAALGNENKLLKDNLTKLNGDMALLTDRQRVALGAVQASQQNQNELSGQVKQLRGDVKAIETERNQNFSEMVAMTDVLHQRTSELDALKNTNMTLVQDVQKYRTAFDRLGIKPEDVARQAPPLECHVQAVSDVGAGLIEITAGADEGLLQGHQLDVFRVNDSGPTYLGKVEVVSTEPHKAVCKILPEFLKGTIQKSDNVTNRIK